MTTVRWRLFADLAEVAGARETTVTVGDDATVGDALDALLDGHDGLRVRVFEDDTLADHVNLLRNGDDASLSETVDDDDELALFPPVSGGAGRRRV
ncbi:molybdopterin synthase sulfur carrier subunit [Halogeometricum rufum]|jgi:molybdopterin synthase sulfur carrier subunit|uniref:Molybdopterin synthase sulfur carrier subunit n=1 Tax=Halogeometricum rufum TaxID=553469 RepID=A0A1I6HUU7_9EURY|nr:MULTISPECIES: ubiquitin-like small modifier protein 1 [Halogeometricum]MUV57931.1 MoaD family protein [Halogeometricum sp. CBA1124]SFR58215.1 molybdopterin synthase sulfur carrier subunit [Halogeometricum rufum]